VETPIHQIVETVKKYTLDSLVERALDRIQKKPLVTQPWILLAYFEIAYREADNNSLKFEATQTVFNTICQQIFELMDKHYFADFKKYNPKRMFHVLAYQQFPYQNQYSYNDIQRQVFIFNAQYENSRLNTKFKEKYGISIKQYLNVWNSITNRSNNPNSAKDADVILKIWTIDHDKVQSELKTFSNGIGNNFYKTFIPDFFLKYPFINYKGRRFCIDPRLFKRTLYEFLFLHVLQSPDIKDSFDNRFQNYVNKTLKDIGILYKIDKQLKTLGQNECDFLISNFLFAECKAIKIKPLAQVNPNDTILKNNLGDISKAYKQIISTANRFRGTKELFGVIITYLPFYFSDGTDIWEIFLNDEITQFLLENKFELLVKPENLFFVDIKSWDRLIDVLKKENAPTLEEIFIDAKSNNSTEIKKFEFSMHLTKYE